jgi:hypothetical protein
MQIVLRNTEPEPRQINFDDDTAINLPPDAELTLQAHMRASIVIEDDQIQTAGIMPPYDAADDILEDDMYPDS